MQTVCVLFCLVAGVLASGCSKSSGSSAPDINTAAVSGEPTVAVAIVNAAAGSTTAGESAEGDWPWWGGPNRNLISAETGLSEKWPDDGLHEQWTREIGIGFSSIAVSGDKALTMGHIDGEEIVWCLDTQTGEVIWTHKYPGRLLDNLHEGGPCSTPTIDGDRVYALGKEGQLYCLSLADGKVIWEQPLQPLLGVKLPEWGFASSGLILNDWIIFEAGRVVAFNKIDGDVVWQTEVHDAGYGSVAVFESDGVQTLASLDCDGLRILKASDGTELAFTEWKSPYRTNSTTPIILNEGIFISTGYNIGCGLFQLEAGELKSAYKNRDMKNHFNNSVYLNGFLYGFDGDSHNGRNVTLNCIEAATGKLRWKERGLGCGSLLIVDSKLIVLSESGELVLAKATPEGFEAISRSPLLDGKCWTVPALSRGQLFARNAAGTLKCVSLSEQAPK